MNMLATRLLAVLAAGLILAACSREAPPPATAPQAGDEAAAEAPPPPRAAPAAEPEYQIQPFPVSGVPLCDSYASEARRCLNQPGHDNQRRRATERAILELLEDVTPENPGDPPNPWLEGSCRTGIEALARRFPGCDVQNPERAGR